MENAKLIIVEAGKEPRELEILGEIVTFGRVPDNSISFAGDSNVSRYHAQIEKRGEDFFVKDFGSSNGTTVNDAPLSGEKQLKHGDKVNFGGESHIVFHNPTDDNADSENAESYEPGFSMPQTPSAASSPKAQPQKSNLPIMLCVAAVLCGVAIVAVVVVAVVLMSDFSGGCSPEVAILSPETGATISESTEIKVNVKNAKCVERVAFFLDGDEVASAETAPYSVMLEAEKFEELKNDDSSHVLTVAVFDRDGKKRMQKDQLLLAFGDEPKEGGDEDKPAGDKPPIENQPPPPDVPRPTNISIADTQAMSEKFIKQFSGGFVYKFDQQFLREVQKRTAEYKSENFSSRALQYRDAINQTFIAEQGLDVPLGYVLAMSRSRFENKKNALGVLNGEGIWQMPADFAASNGYNGQCGAETLSDAKQNCAARAAAIYTKALVINLFQGDVVYAASCFGMSPQEAGQFQIILQADRSDFWNVIKNQKQREALARFFAAGIVAENPEKFGLKKDKKLSELYKNLIVVK